MSTPFQLIQVFDDPSAGYRGNIASVLILESRLEVHEMQKIATDLAQPATTFLYPGPTENEYEVRWFAPDGEIGLCGHGSMAAVAFLGSKFKGSEYLLHYKQGTVAGKFLSEDKVQISLTGILVSSRLNVDSALEEGLGIPIVEYWHTANKDLVLVESEDDLLNMQPDFSRLRDRETFGYTVTAPGNAKDFVSRTLVPHVQQLEDHATGSSHAILVPFWADRLGKNILHAVQLSPRKGLFSCEYMQESNQVVLTGNYSIIARGELAE